jgi:hypothetical protein
MIDVFIDGRVRGSPAADGIHIHIEGGKTSR